MNERRFGAGLARGFEQVQRADRVRIEVVKRDCGGAIVGWLRSGVDDGIGLEAFDQFEDAGAIADIHFMMPEHTIGQVGHEPLLIPPCISLGAEKHGALIVINTVDLEALFSSEILANLGADEAR